MKWFEGSIAEAVAATKLKKAVFVVFVEGKDEISQKVAASINSTEVSSRLESEDFVAIKLESDTENYTFFAQIYQLVPVPSIFFIEQNGTPLEIIGNFLSPSELSSKIESVLEKAKPQAKHSSASLIDAEQKAHSSSSNQETNNVQAHSSQDPAPSESNEKSNDLPNSNSTSSDVEFKTEESPKPQLTPEEKVRRARELIELQKQKKQKEEADREKEREIERRKMSKDVQKLREQQQHREITEAHKERLTERAAKEKILKQIAEDKLERKRKYEMHVQEKAVQQEKRAKEDAQARAQAVAAATDMTKARIQFKLPVGNTITGTFEATSTLGSLRTYVVENAQLPFRQFAMSSFFPRRDFSTTDDSKTLLELELVPSAVILILPIKSNNPASVIKSADGAGIFSHFFWTLLAPVVSIYNYVMGYFSGRPQGGQNDGDSDSRNPGSSFGSSANAAFGRVANVGARRLGGPGTTKIRARGNIHTLHSGDNDNDENNTWNGNSTQQM